MDAAGFDPRFRVRCLKHCTLLHLLLNKRLLNIIIPSTICVTKSIIPMRTLSSRAETWTTTVITTQRIRRILGIWWPEVIISNELLWQRACQMPVEQEIRQRRWRRNGYTLRKPVYSITRQALTWNPDWEEKMTTWKHLALRHGSRRQRNWSHLETVGRDWLRTGVPGVATLAAYATEKGRRRL